MRNGGDAVRICQVSEKGCFCGGIERFVFDAAAALRAAGCEVYGSFRTTGNADGFAAGFDGLVPWGEFPEGFDLVILHRAADPAVLDGWNRKNRTLLYGSRMAGCAVSVAPRWSRASRGAGECRRLRHSSGRWRRRAGAAWWPRRRISCWKSWR